MRAILFALLLTVSGLTAAAPLYRWVDAHGQVHYGDQPPDGAQRVRQRLHDGSAPAPAPASSAAPAADGGGACRRAKAELQRYRSATSITATDPLGKSQVYTAAQRDKLIAVTQTRVDQACGHDAADDGAGDDDQAAPTVAATPQSAPPPTAGAPQPQ